MFCKAKYSVTAVYYFKDPTSDEQFPQQLWTLKCQKNWLLYIRQPQYQSIYV